MKKTIPIIASLATLLIISGCGSTTEISDLSTPDSTTYANSFVV